MVWWTVGNRHCIRGSYSFYQAIINPLQPLVIDLRVTEILVEYLIFRSSYISNFIIKARWIFIITNNSFFRNIVVKNILGFILFFNKWTCS